MSADPIPVLCVLARYHKGGHDEGLARASRSSTRCGKVVRMIEPDVNLEPAGSPEEYVQREEDEMQEGAVRDHEGPGVDVDRYNEERRATEMVTDDTREAREMGGVLSMDGAAVEGERGPGLAGCGGHDHGSLTRCMPPCPAFRGGEEPLRADPAERAAERLGNEDEPVASAVAGEGAPVVYPLLSAALLSTLRASVGGLSFQGIVGKFPGADVAEVSDALSDALAAGTIVHFESDDEPPVKVYIEALAQPAPDPSPASPSPADLTAAVVTAFGYLQAASEAAEEAAAQVTRCKALLSRAIDAKARSLPKGGFCAIGGVTYRAKPPRKVKGQAEDTAALWTLERVQVGE